MHGFCNCCSHAALAFAGTGIGICGVLAWSALPLMTGQAAKLNARPSTAAATDEEEGDGVKFGVMTVVGAIPLVNWSVSISFLLDQCQFSIEKSCCIRWSCNDIAGPHKLCVPEDCLYLVMQLFDCCAASEDQGSDAGQQLQIPTRASKIQQQCKQCQCKCNSAIEPVLP